MSPYAKFCIWFGCMAFYIVVAMAIAFMDRKKKKGRWE